MNNLDILHLAIPFSEDLAGKGQNNRKAPPCCFSTLFGLFLMSKIREQTEKMK
jgi:hypothetical protein